MNDIKSIIQFIYDCGRDEKEFWNLELAEKKFNELLILERQRALKEAVFEMKKIVIVTMSCHHFDGLYIPAEKINKCVELLKNRYNK